MHSPISNEEKQFDIPIVASKYQQFLRVEMFYIECLYTFLQISTIFAIFSNLKIETVLSCGFDMINFNADYYAFLMQKIRSLFISHDIWSVESRCLQRIISRLGVLAIDRNRVDGLTVHTQGITRIAGEAAIIFKR